MYHQQSEAEPSVAPVEHQAGPAALSYPAPRVIQRQTFDPALLTDAEAGRLAGNAGVKLNKPHYETTNLTIDGETSVAGKTMTAIISPTHEQGSSPKGNAQDKIFTKLPTIGTEGETAAEKAARKAAGLAKDPVSGNKIYVKGHLLNDNLGGPGEEKNLFPITVQANERHKNTIEKAAKEMVNEEGRIALYKVIASQVGAVASGKGRSRTLFKIDGTFDCTLIPISIKDSKPTLDSGRGRRVLIKSTYENDENAADQKLDGGNVAPLAEMPMKDFDAEAVQWAPSRMRKAIVDNWAAYKASPLDFARELGNNNQGEVFFIKWLIDEVKGVGRKRAKALVAEVAAIQAGNLAALSKNARVGYDKLLDYLSKIHNAAWQAYLTALAKDVDDTTASADSDEVTTAQLLKVSEESEAQKNRSVRAGLELGDSLKPAIVAPPIAAAPVAAAAAAPIMKPGLRRAKSVIDSPLPDRVQKRRPPISHQDLVAAVDDDLDPLDPAQGNRKKRKPADDSSLPVAHSFLNPESDAKKVRVFDTTADSVRDFQLHVGMQMDLWGIGTVEITRIERYPNGYAKVFYRLPQG